MAKLGFLGLGIMGAPMAAQLIKAGHSVTVWSHNAGKAEKFAHSHHAALAQTPAEVGKASECVFLCVGDTEMSRAVILDEQGVAAGAKKGTVIADCSTISAIESRRIAGELQSRGIEYLDAPCTGSTAGAESGTLSFMVGGRKEVFERIQPYFEAMGKRLYYCGGSGMGLRAKLTQNLILGNLLQALNEGLVLSAKAGVDPELMLDILNNSAARSAMVSSKAPAIFKRDFETHFSLKWLEKDIGLAIELAADVGVPVPLTGLTRQLCRAGISAGYGDEDIAGSIRVLEKLAGCEVRSA